MAPGTYRIRAVTPENYESQPVIKQVTYEPYTEALRVDLKVIKPVDLSNVNYELKIDS